MSSPEKMFPLKHTPAFAKFALTASIEAISQSKLFANKAIKHDRIGVIIGSGFGEINSLVANKATHRLSPYFIPGVLMSSASAQVALCFGLQGPSFAVSSACATGSHSIGIAFSEIQNGKADAMVCGGAEHTSSCYPIHEGFHACRALARHFKETPEKASRPFDKDRCGFVLGEGAGVVVLEEMEHAKKRGAKVLAEILGHGQSTDSYHITSPSPNGEGAKKAISSAISDELLKKGFLEEIGFISAHASSTKIGDLSEARLIRTFFNDSLKKPAVYSIKGSLGHSLGASGAVEAIIGIKSLNEGIIPPTLNLENLEEEFDLDFVRGKKREKEAKCFLANSFGFGGHNSCLLIGSKNFSEEF